VVVIRESVGVRGELAGGRICRDGLRVGLRRFVFLNAPSPFLSWQGPATLLNNGAANIKKENEV